MAKTSTYNFGSVHYIDKTENTSSRTICHYPSSCYVTDILFYKVCAIRNEYVTLCQYFQYFSIKPPSFFHLVSSCTANWAKAMGYSSACLVLKPPDAAPLSWICFWSVNLQTRSPFTNLSLHFIQWTSDGNGCACQSQHRVGFCHFVPKKQKSHTSCCQHRCLVKASNSGTDHIMLRKGFSNPQGTIMAKHFLMMIKDCCKVRFPFESVLRSPSWRRKTPQLGSKDDQETRIVFPS